MRRVAVALVGLLVLATPLSAVGLVCWWLLVSAELPGRSWIRRGLFGTLVVFAVNAGVLTALAVLHLACRPRVLLGVLLLLALAAQLRRRPRHAVPFASATDCWSLGLGAVTFALLCAPLVGASTGKVMALLSRTTDGATHVQLLTAILRGHGYVQLAHPAGLSAGVADYPSGWHANVWVLSDLLLGGHPGVRALLTLTAVCAVATFSLMSTLAAEVVLALARVGGPAALVGLAMLSLVTVFGVGLLLLQLGSYTQLLAISAVLGVVLVAAEPYGRGSLLVAGACAISLTQTWYLLGLVVALPLAVVLLVWQRPPRALLAFVVGTGPVCLFPIVTGPSLSQIDAPGPKTLPTLVGVLGLLLATALGFLHALRATRTLEGRVLATATLGGLLTLVALLLREGSLADANLSYYAAKVMLSVLLLGGVGGCALVASHLERPDRMRALAVVATALGLAAGAWTTRGLTVPPRLNDSGRHVDPATLQAIVSAHPQGEPQGTISVVADGCDRVWDRVATKWLADTTLSWSPLLSRTLAAYAVEPRGRADALQRVAARSDIRAVELFVHHECDPTALAQLDGNPKVRVIRVP